jgi:hypothetical protein
MVPCLACGGPLFFVAFVSEARSRDSSLSPLSSGVGSKVLCAAFEGDSVFADDVGPGDVTVREDDAGIEARFAAFVAWVLWGSEVCDIDCGRAKGAELIGVD